MYDMNTGLPQTSPLVLPFFFFNDTATTEIYTLSLHDALPIFDFHAGLVPQAPAWMQEAGLEWAYRLAHEPGLLHPGGDRKSTRLNSSHSQISYAVFCLKKKKTERICCLSPV